MYLIVLSCFFVAGYCDAMKCIALLSFQASGWKLWQVQCIHGFLLENHIQGEWTATMQSCPAGFWSRSSWDFHIFSYLFSGPAYIQIVCLIWCIMRLVAIVYNVLTFGLSHNQPGLWIGLALKLSVVWVRVSVLTPKTEGLKRLPTEIQGQNSFNLLQVSRD